MEKLPTPHLLTYNKLEKGEHSKECEGYNNVQRIRNIAVNFVPSMYKSTDDETYLMRAMHRQGWNKIIVQK